ncbi:MAG: pre-16S rRNA-processing nuclease YqgF [Armatimonadetes bacterium]|nr:pre-16S rRNA-processing nuclease YqgF [Armatimonadota bacterium]
MTALGERTVLAVDPGSSKCGMAVVHRSVAGRLDLLWRAVVPTGQLKDRVLEAVREHAFSMVIVGSGTRSKDIVAGIRESLPSVGILVVDERDTTLKARERYWEHNPRRGWRKLLPSTLQTPPEPVDDFVALILAERVLSD